MNVTMLLYPRLTQLDLTGPFEVFSRFPELQCHLVWKTLDPVSDGSGLRILPNHTFERCPPADILFVPGGPGQIEIMDDEETLAFLRQQAEQATYITSVCTGSLILAAAGLLSGHRATCHWSALDQLILFGVEPDERRVVENGSRITGAGVTSGIDFAFAICARLYGPDRAQSAQLGIEYDPQPPYPGGSLKSARPEIIAGLRKNLEHFIDHRRSVSKRAAARSLSTD